jgi:hypothetical protein
VTLTSLSLSKNESAVYCLDPDGNNVEAVNHG